MKVTITVKLTPESREEMVAKYGGQYRLLRDHMEKLVASGVLPQNATLRWLLESGRWE